MFHPRTPFPSIIFLLLVLYIATSDPRAIQISVPRPKMAHLELQLIHHDCQPSLARGFSDSLIAQPACD